MKPANTSAEDLVQLRRDRERLTWLQDLVKHCPTASFHFNKDPDVEFPDGDPMPVGFTLLVVDVEEPVQVTAPTFRKLIDAARVKMAQPV